MIPRPQYLQKLASLRDKRIVKAVSGGCVAVRSDAVLIVLLCLCACTFCFGQIDPYTRNSGKLAKHFSPQKIDFSNDFFEMSKQTEKRADVKEQLQQSLIYDYSSIWLTGDRHQNGIIGLNYQRIQIHIGKVTKSEDSKDTYLVKGKSKVNNNICDFSGEIKLIRLFNYGPQEYHGPGDEYVLYAAYIFYEDSAQNGSGVFKGIMRCDVALDSTKTKMVLDECMEDADGYDNRTFVGTWTSYKTNVSKKCIWGDYRLPFVFGFDCGDGEMIVCKEYVKNGWQTYNDGSEYIELSNGRYGLKNKWWVKK